MLNATNEEEALVVKTLKELDDRFETIANEVDLLDDLIETVVLFRPSNLYLYQNETEGNTTEASTSNTERISEYTASLLLKTATSTAESIRSLKSSEIRSILHRFVALPYPVDQLIEVAQEEIQRRRVSLEKNALSFSALRDAISKVPSDVLKDLLATSKTSSDPYKLFKKMARSLASADRTENAPDHVDSHTATGEAESGSSPADKIIGIILAAVDVSDSEVDFPTQKSDPVEYGRIQELINQYKRIDFESGARLSRYDKEGQRLMAKRMMSRLLP